MSGGFSVLVAEDDAILRGFLLEALARMGHEAVGVGTVKEATGRLRSGKPFDLVLSDLRLPDGEGIEILRAAREGAGPPEVILLTAYGTVEKAVEAVKAGAREFLLKPFPVEVLDRYVAAALEGRVLRREIERLRATAGGLEAADPFATLIGSSDRMRRLVETARRAAQSDATALLLGETGTGKEVLARAIHRASPRADHPFVAVHASAIPSALLEAELFGHARGAFTGATRDRAGLVEEAARGTLFLDEVGELPGEIQVKLLRFLQERTFRRVGENAERMSNVRVLAATNRDLVACVAEGSFREDLFYRLNILSILLPPLRERREDIPPLATHLLLRACAESGREGLALSPEVLDAYARHGWPGNVRELENVIRRAVALTVGPRVEESFLDAEGGSPGEAPPPPESGSLSGEVERLERRLIENALKRSGGVRARAAEMLGLKRTTLIEKLKKLGL